MAYKIRQLLPEEFYRLEGLPIAANGIPDPTICNILIAELENGDIVGVWSTVSTTALEGLWVREDYRHKTLTAAKLLQSMKMMLGRLGIIQCFTIIQDEYVARLAEKAGFIKVPGDLYMLLNGVQE